MATTSTTTPTSTSPSSNSTAPSTPLSPASSVVNATKPFQGCTSPECPINHPHERGLYIHSCRVPLSAESRRIFAPSDPPPDVLAAYERCLRYEGTRTDAETWVTFHELHVEPLLGHTNAVWVSPRPGEFRDDDVEDDESADADDVEAHDETKDCRHPFGLLNPPEIVWEAHRRLVLGDGCLWDREFVDAFAAKNVYFGKGLGKQKSPSSCFKIRRPGHLPVLAKREPK